MRLTHWGPKKHIYQWTGSSLFQIMVCHHFSDNPLPELMLTYRQLNPKQIWIKIGKISFTKMYSKILLAKCQPFCSGFNVSTLCVWVMEYSGTSLKRPPLRMVLPLNNRLYFFKMICISNIFHRKSNILVRNWCNTMNILLALLLLMAWCFSTRAAVATVLNIHPCISSRLRVKCETVSQQGVQRTTTPLSP